MSRIRKYPMIVLLLPLLAVIGLCNRIGGRYECLRHTPVNLLYQTELDGLDSLRDYTFVITSPARHTNKCERYEADLLPRGKVLLYILRDEANVQPQTGDTICAQTAIRRPEPVGSFDYGLYLRRQGIIGTAFAGRYTLLPSAVSGRKPLQQRLYGRLKDAGLSGDELATVGALTLGYKEDLDPDLRRHFQASGAAHVLAVSGLHTGIIYALLIGLLTLGGRCKPLYENRFGRSAICLIIIGVMWFYAWLTGMTPSVVRAVLMVTIFEVGRMAYRQAISLNTIAAAAFLILIVRPLDMWSVSFQLSFAATAAIVILTREVQRRKELTNLNQTISGRIVNSILGIIIISLAAQVGTLPLTMYYFGQISNYFLLTNLIVLPLAFFLVPAGLISLTLGGTAIGLWFCKITNGLAWTMNHSVEWIESLPGSTTHVQIGMGMVVIYYAIVIIFCLLYANICTRQKKSLSLQPK